jgi:tetratricopeptide (TPR) repeat protein
MQLSFPLGTQAGRYHEAVEKYNDAIDLDPEIPAYYTNRAFCHLKMENHGLAIADATVALELDRTFVKAYYRRGSAFMALAKYKDALRDLKSVRQLKPTDKDALAKVERQPCFLAAPLCLRVQLSPFPSASVPALAPPGET